MIGNKADLEEERVIRKEQGEKMKRDYGFDIFMETSAKTGFNAQELFVEASKLLYEENSKLKDMDLTKITKSKTLYTELNEDEIKRKNFCC